ncbi:MAG: hypothetical protein V1770_05665 [bacterium]
MDYKIFKIIFIFISSVILSLVYFSFREPKISEAGELDTMSGWLWSSNAGWISLNDLNCLVSNCDIFGFEYGVNVRQYDGMVSGEAWSENFGWICFGETCDAWELGNAPDGNTPSALFDGVKFSGWANIHSLGEEGWFKLQGPAVSAAGKKGASCFDCYYDEGTKCKSCFTEISDQNYGLVGNVCYDCSLCATSSLPYICDGCSSCNKYGLIVDSDAKQIYGWTWGGTDNNRGIGWIKAYEYNALYEPFAWIETKYGNIYSKQEIDAKSAPPGRYNATYCIHASGIITEFNTKGGCEITTTPGYEEILLPNQSNLYTNVLGKIDMAGIVSGRYGEVEIINQSNAKTKHLTKNGDDDEIQDMELGGKIYYVSGDLTINKELEFSNTLQGDASGLILVEGNLTILKDIFYDDSGVHPPYQRIKDLASVGWIVKGNLTISPEVQQVLGAFYVEGANGISTGVSNTSLTIYGLMVAKKYSFEREYESIVRGSERIIYDGRALINTPPGMEDLTKALPLYKEAAP